MRRAEACQHDHATERAQRKAANAADFSWQLPPLVSGGRRRHPQRRLTPLVEPTTKDVEIAAGEAASI
jgi:hypothetical protein